MGRKYFGTDGIRGLVGVAPITPDFVMRLGYAAGKVLAKSTGTSGRPTVLIGKDTRVSGYMLESSLEAGFNAAGVDVMLAGPMPTPAIAYLTRALRLTAGVVISASHNPYHDNGIKFFSGQGTKLPDSLEEKYDIFRTRGRIFRENEELFNDTSWFAVMIGQNITPRSFDPVAGVLSVEETRRRLKQTAEAISNSADYMPTHEAFIREHCDASVSA